MAKKVAGNDKNNVESTRQLIGVGMLCFHLIWLL